MEPFKNLLNPALVQAAAAHLARVHPPFPAQAFVNQAQAGLEALELKARALHICTALQAALPARFEVAADVIEAALAPPEAGENVGQLQAWKGGCGAGSCGRWANGWPSRGCCSRSARCRCCTR